jgi:diguanylate cyclase (GGDEF)-like protein
MPAAPALWRNLQTRLITCLDRLTPGGGGAEAQLRARMLAGFVLLQTLITVCFTLYVLNSDLPLKMRWSAPSITIGLMLLYLFCLWRLKRGARRGLIVHAVVGLTFAVLTTSVIITGGLYVTPIPLLLVLVSPFAFCLGGQRAGLIWSFAVLVTLLVVGNLELRDITALDYQSEHLHSFSRLIFVTMVTSLAAILLVYEQIYSWYGHQLLHERQDYYNQAHTDKLTGLANRRRFELALQEKLTDAAHAQQLLTLVYIDLNDFKPVNDLFGHDAGDWLLQQTARRIEQCLRPKDIGARLGGDEFGVLISGLDDTAQADKVIARLRCELAHPVCYETLELCVGASIGYATYPADAVTADALGRCADRMMYQEKHRQKKRANNIDSSG